MNGLRWLAAVLVAVVPLAVDAEPRRWTSAGPLDAAADVLAVDPFDPDVVWAAGRNGVWVSSDAGATWERRWPTPVGEAVADLVLDPEVPGRAWARACRIGQGDFRVVTTEDAGRSWRELDIGGPVTLVIGVPDPDGFVLLAVADGGYSLLRSLDRGATWSPLTVGGVDPNLQPGAIRDVALRSLRTGTLFATLRNGVYRSRDDGRSWQRLGGGLPQDVAFELEVDGAGGALYAVSPDRLLRSDDWGEGWLELPAPPFDAWSSLQVARDGSGRLLAATCSGLLVSADRGATWQELAAPEWIGCPNVVAAAASAPDRLYATGRPNAAGTASSDDGGGSWSASGGVFRPVAVHGLNADPFREGRLVAAASDGLYHSTDLGTVWSRLSGDAFRAAAPDHAVPGRWYGNVTAADGSGFGSSDDGGAAWTLLPGPLDGELLWSLTSDPGRSGHLLAWTPDGHWSSCDGGETWRRFEPESPFGVLPRTFVTDPHRPGWRIATGGPFVSEDGGDTWHWRGRGLEHSTWTGHQTQRAVSGVAVDPFRPGLVYLAGDLGVWVGSAKEGERWRLASRGLPAPRCEAHGPLEWCDCAGAIAADPVRPGHLYVDTVDGIYWSADGARSWRPFPGEGLPDPPRVGGLLVSADGSRLLAVNPDGGVWVYPLAEALDAPRHVTGRRTRP